ncbi:hypothetical protein BJX61DRAFT_518594 [Aspergillus egyptiacus]|nr:hypothetical protein BJX61DRAFT_518594 [Aspergillus egyptiacus]
MVREVFKVVYPLLTDQSYIRIPQSFLRLPKIHRPIPPIASRIHTPIGPHRVIVQGPHVDSEDAADHREPLLSQLRNIPRDTTILTVEEDPPSDTEWGILGDHFTNVEDLTIDTGFHEDLNDRKMPLHWPLQRLEIQGVCGEVTKSPHILQGRVGHLILYFTSEMRFEGPRSDELSDAYQKEIARGEVEARYIGRLQIIHMSELALDWMSKKYTTSENPNPSPQLEPENRPLEDEEIRLHTLEIIENDALDTFQRMTLALPHLVANLTTLHLRSTSNPPDFSWINEDALAAILPQLTNLQTLTLYVGDVFRDPSSLPALYTWLPPNLTTLHFRGPASLCRSERWEEWIGAFASGEFLPRLRRLAFVLDFHYEVGQYKSQELADAPEELLQQARTECDRLCEAARRRGVSIEVLHDEWAGRHGCLRPVDSRW